MRSVALLFVVGVALGACDDGAHLLIRFESLDASADHVTVTLRSPEVAFAGRARSQGSVAVSYATDGTIAIDAGRDAFADGTLELALSAPSALNLMAHASATRAGAPDGAADTSAHVTPGQDVQLSFDFAAVDAGANDLEAPPDQAMPDLQTPPSLCATSGMLLCDGFELDQVDQSRWTLDTLNGGAVLVDFNRAYRGKHSLHVLMPSLNPLQKGAAAIDESQTFAADLGTHIGELDIRAFVYVPSPGFGEIELFSLSQSGALNSQEMAIELDNGNLALFDDINNQKVLLGSTMPLPLDQWVCVELHMNGLQVTVSMNDQILGMLGGTEQVAPTPPLDVISFGLAEYRRGQNMPPPVEAWFDEVAIDDQPIGCAR